MKFYVATKWEERGRARHIMDILKDWGHEITHDWTIADDDNKEHWLMLSLTDQAGVRECDVFVAYMERELPYRGCLIELGMAIAYGKPVALIGDCNETVFFYHPAIMRFDDIGHFLSWLTIVGGGNEQE